MESTETAKQGIVASDFVHNVEENLFNEELVRLRKISLDEMQLPSPAKRRKLSSCSMESKLTNNICGLLTSPVKPMAV